jgi:hypothetical protein
VGPAGATGPAGPAGPPGPQGPAGPAGSGAYAEDEPGFAGFTVAAYTGAIGGRPAAHGACSVEFPGAHLCHASEYLLSAGTVQPPASGAWLDPSVTPDGSYTLAAAIHFGRNVGGGTCNDWQSTSAAYAGLFLQPGGAFSSSATCGSARSLACCNSVPKVQFAGFTSGTTTGDVGGRPSAHGICAAQFAGAHMCHAAEYLRAVSSASVPPEGAWLDPSVDFTGSYTLAASPVFGRNIGGGTCNDWQSTGAAYAGLFLQPGGQLASSATCATARRIACCL